MNILMPKTATTSFAVLRHHSFSEIIVVTMASFCGILSLGLSFLIFWTILTVNSVSGQASSGAHYRGRYIGPIAAKKHKVSGEVYAVDSRTLHIRGFNYDGTGPDAFFWTGFTEHPSQQGVIIPNERGTKEVLGPYSNQDITISLPDGLTLRDVKWIAVWCRAYEVNFGDLYIPINLDYPQPHVVGSLVGQQGVTSGPIVVVDAQTILVPDFTYDGQAPDLHFWVGRGIPGPQGLRVPDETGTDAPLQKADKKTMVLSLPGDLTVFDIDYFGVWCRLYSIDFGHVRVTPGLNVPPSLRMLGVAPQSKLNCEVLHEDSAFEIRWSVVESGETIVFQLVGRIDNGKYMAVGLSGEDDRSVMVGGDAMLGYFDQTTQRGNVVDYHLGGKSVCNTQGNTGSCPDVRFKEGANNVRLLSAASVNGFTILTFQRKLEPLDGLDKKIRTNESQPIIWAIGNLMQDNLAGYHEIRNRDDISIDFGRSPKWNCPEPQTETDHNNPTSSTFTTTTSKSVVPSSIHNSATTAAPVLPNREQGASASTIGIMAQLPTAWRIPPIPCTEPDDGVFYLHLGPIGRKDIFTAVTGKLDPPSNVWYVNGLLMPEIYLVRNKNYTFVVQGGDNGFYITDNKIGDFLHSSESQKQQTGIFGGVEFDSQGNGRPTAVGKLCRWIESESDSSKNDVFASYAAYQRTLTLECGKGHSGILQFRPDKSTPNLVYYQSFSRPNMGWKIHIVDQCGGGKNEIVEGSSSSQSQILVSAPLLQSEILQQVDQNIGESNNNNNIVQHTFLHHSPNILTMNDKHQHSFQMKDMQQQQQPAVMPIQPIQNAYIIDTTMDGSASSFPNLQQFDSRLIFKGNNKPLEPPQSQGSHHHHHRPTMIAARPGNPFQFPQTPGVYQIAIDTSGDGSGSGNGGHSRNQHPNIFTQTGYQMQDNHFLRRNGPPTVSPSNYNKYPLPHPPPPPLQSQSSYSDRLDGGYYESKPEYFAATRSPPLMSIPGGRYENQPPPLPPHNNNNNGPTVMYATTMVPQRRHGGGGLLPFMTHDSPSDVLMRSPTHSPLGGGGGGNGGRVQIQNGPWRPPPMEFQQGMMNHENVHVKYMEHPPGPPSSPVKISMQNDGRLGGGGGNAPPIWVHTRNLPKRDGNSNSNNRGRDVTPFLRRSTVRQGLRRVTRGFREFTADEEDKKKEEEQTRVEGIKQQDENEKKEKEGNFSPGESGVRESGAVQPISRNIQGRESSNETTTEQRIPSHPTFQSFFDPPFRASPPDRIETNGSTSHLLSPPPLITLTGGGGDDFVNQLQPFPPSQNNKEKSQALLFLTPPQRHHHHRHQNPWFKFKSFQQKQKQKQHQHRLSMKPILSVQHPKEGGGGGGDRGGGGGGIMYRPIKLGLRELLRQPGLIPQQLLAFRSPGFGGVGEFVKVSSSSPSLESTTTGLKPSRPGLRQVHKGHKVFRPRNDHIASQQQNQPAPTFSAVPAALKRIENSTNVSFILLDDDDDDAGDGEGDINPVTEKVSEKDDKIIPGREESSSESSGGGDAGNVGGGGGNTNNGEQLDQLSLTLLTDVWQQIINQQGISIQQHQRPVHQNQNQHKYISKQDHHHHHHETTGKPGRRQIPVKMIIKAQQQQQQKEMMVKEDEKRNMIRKILRGSSAFFRIPFSGKRIARGSQPAIKDEKEQDKDFKETKEDEAPPLLQEEATMNISNSVQPAKWKRVDEA